MRIAFAACLAFGLAACAPTEAGHPGSGEGGAGTGGEGSHHGLAAGAGGSGGVIAYEPNPCIQDGSCPPGEWIRVAPEVDTETGSCGNYGTKSVRVDPKRPQDLYASFNCQGIWKSTDYGQTWKGPINMGENGAEVGDCAGAMALAPAKFGDAPVLYQACIRGGAVGSPIGFWRSSNGGVDWNRFVVTPAPNDAIGQQFYAPAVDPYDGEHLLMAAHGADLLVESVDGGETWKALKTESSMAQQGGTSAINFIDTGDAETTRTTWLWMAAGSGGVIGTWRTETGDDGWEHVETHEHTAGSMHSEIFQPDTSGLLFSAGVYSELGWGVLRSEDFGKSWTHVGAVAQQAVVFGTKKRVYAMFGWGIGAGGVVEPSLEVGGLAADSAWSTPGTPEEMTQGPAQAAVTTDGTYSIIVTANYNAGLWRYIEPVK